MRLAINLGRLHSILMDRLYDMFVCIDHNKRILSYVGSGIARTGLKRSVGRPGGIDFILIICGDVFIFLTKRQIFLGRINFQLKPAVCVFVMG